MAIRNLPFGFKFAPSEVELFLYLYCKVNNVKRPDQILIELKEIDIYKYENPEDLFMNTYESVVYVFTKLKNMVVNGTRFDRKVERSTWMGNDKGDDVEFMEGCKGKIKNFSFKDSKKVRLGYNMKEFSLDESIIVDAKYRNYVLCQIKKKSKGKENSETENLLEETEDPFSYDDQALPAPNQYDDQELTAQTESDYNGFIDIDSILMEESCNEVQQQYIEMNETISSVPLLHSAADQGSQTQYQELTPFNIESCQVQYDQEMPFNQLLYQNQYQVRHEFIPQADEVCRDQYQKCNQLMVSDPSIPHFEGNPYQENLWAYSTDAFTQPEELNRQFNIHSDFDTIVPLASAPEFSSLEDV